MEPVRSRLRLIEMSSSHTAVQPPISRRL